MSYSKMLALAALSALTAHSLGQIVTPPPAKTPTMEEKHPVTIAPPPQPQPAPPAAEPIKLNPTTKPKGGLERLKRDDLPKDINFRALVEFDADDLVKPLNEPIDHAAMRKNPTLGEGFIERNAAYLNARRESFEKVVIGNLDVVEKVHAGEIDNWPTKEKNWMTGLVNFLAPISGKSVPDSLPNAMQKDAVMDKVQAEVTRQIADEYRTVRMNRLNKKLDKDGLQKDDRAWALVKYLQSTSSNVEECVHTFRGLAAEAAGKLSVAESMDIPAEMKQAAKTAAANYRDTLDQAQKLKIYQDATASWTTAQRQDLLKKVIEARSAAK